MNLVLGSERNYSDGAGNITHGSQWVRLWFLLGSLVLSSQGAGWIMNQQSIYYELNNWELAYGAGRSSPVEAILVKVSYKERFFAGFQKRRMV